MMEYLRVVETGGLPDMRDFKPFKAVAIIEIPVSQQRQHEVSDWLVRSGCRYMMAWGPGCNSWDDSVDMANMKRFSFGDIPDEEFIMTTWHEEESLDDVFHFARTAAITYDQSEELPNVLLLHLSEVEKKEELKARYKNASQAGPNLA